MNISKIATQTTHRKWCMGIMKEQKQSARAVRNLLRKTEPENPFVNNKQIDEILAEYENNFWGSRVCWNDIPKLL